jgi:hypothetical protein
MQQQKPAWWQLYLIVPIMVGLAVLESKFSLPGISSELADLLIVFFAFSAMFVWVQINRGLIEYDEIQKDRSLDHLKVTVYEPPAQTEDEEKDQEHWQPNLSIQRETHLEFIGLSEPEDEDTWHLN